MNDNDLGPVLERLVAERKRIGPSPALQEAVWAIPDTTSVERSWLPRIDTGGLTMFSALKFVAAGVIVALFGGFLLAGILTTPQEAEVLPAAVTESPSPMTSEGVLAGMVTEEVEPGVYRVVNDGARDLASKDNFDVVAGHDDGIWLLRWRDFLRLGSDGTHGWPLRSVGPESHVLDVAPDGAMWVIGRRYEGDEYPDARIGEGFRSTDGEDWTVQPCPEFCRGLEVAPDGTVWRSWSEEGWQRWRVGHLGPSGWQPLDGYLPRGSAEHGYERLFFTDAGDVYGADYYMGELSRYQDGGWQPIIVDTVLLDVGRDGTVWQAGGLGDDGSFRGDDLKRFADGEWTRWTSADLPDIRLGLDYEFEVGPDGSLWFGLWRTADGELPKGDSWIDDWFDAVQDGRLVCDGLARFDGKALDRFLPGQCISMDTAADGSVWVLAGGEKIWLSSAEDGYWTEADAEEVRDLYVITPEAVAATE